MEWSSGRADGLKRTWDAFILQCQKKFPEQITRPTDMDSLRAQLEEQVRKDEPDGRKSVDYFMRSLACISKASEVISQAAAIAFPPAQLCGNAIVLVLDSTRKVTGAFADLVKLVERMDAFLETLKLHLEQEEANYSLPELCDVCDKVLRQFLTVLQLIYKLSNSKRERMKAAFKIFSEDNEIQNALEDLEVAVSDFTRQDIAVILSKVSKSARDILEVREGVAALVDFNTLKVIERALSLRGFGKVGEQNRKSHTHHSNRALPGTGQWFLRSPEYQSWLDGTTDPVLNLAEMRSGGKTMLANRIICHLQQTQKADVAYFYNTSVTTLSALGWALRCMIWQLVQSDALYAKLVEEKLGRVDISTTLALWENFLVNPPDHKPAATRYLVLDGFFGVDQRAADFLARMFRDVAASTTIRLLTTGRLGATYNKINNALRASGQRPFLPFRFAERDEVDGRRNGEDIELLAKYYLNDSIWTAEDQDLVAKTMIRTLNSRDLFHDLFSTVSELNKCVGRDSLEPKLDALDAKCREARIKEVTERLACANRELGPEQIIELNTILPWVVACGGSCEVALLDEVLRLKSPGHSEMGQTGKRPIANRLHLYSSLLGGGGKRKRVHFWGNIDPFGYMDRQQATSPKRQARNQQSKVPRHEVEVMRTFLKTFCKPAMYDKFGFDAFFDSKLQVSGNGALSKDTVCMEKDRGQLDVLKTCLEALIKRKLDGTCRRIHAFAREHLAELLRYELLSEADIETQKEVTLMLLQYIRNPYFPGAWHLNQPDKKIDLKRLALVIQKWFGHETAQDMLKESADRSLIEEFRASKEPETVLLRQMSHVAAAPDQNEDDVVAGATGDD